MRAWVVVQFDDWKSRFPIWLGIGLIALSAVMFIETGRLLGSIEATGEQAFGTWVFTGISINPFDTEDIETAVAVWSESKEVALNLLKNHFLVDLFLFIPAFAFLFAKVLSATTTNVGFSRRYAFWYAIVDAAETALGAMLLYFGRLEQPSHWALVGLQSLSDLKWLILLGGAVILVVFWINPNVGTSSLQQGLERSARVAAGGPQTPGAALKSQVVLVALLGVVVLAPFGGPLDQLPDVLRSTLDQGPATSIASAVALAILIVLVTVGGWLSTTSLSAALPVPAGRWSQLRKVLLLTTILVVGALVIDEALNPAPFAGLAVYAVLVIAAWVVSAAGGGLINPNRPDSWGQETKERAHVWVGALSGAVLVIGSLGLVRATYPVLVLNLAQSERIFWWVMYICGIFVALLGGSFIQALVIKVRSSLTRARDPTRSRRVAIAVGLLLTFAPFVWLGGWPDQARWIGTNGVIVIGLGAFSALAGVLALWSRHGRRWNVTQALGVSRTPWMGLILLVWVAAGLMNGDGGYHDARVESEFPEKIRHPSLGVALDEWWRGVPDGCVEDGNVPLVLVSAPGGGIRAAYWTSRTLDKMFPRDDPCAAHAVFAVSGVSGGSVGTALWLASRTATADVKKSAVQLAADRGLAAATAALVFRDSVQPFVGASKWRDRSAVMEDVWGQTVRPFDPSTDSGKWAKVGDGENAGWTPVVVLNGSSVADGCRVIISNTGALAQPGAPDCLSANQSAAEFVPVSSSVEASSALLIKESRECGTTGGLRTTTAAYLSARFPVVATSGAIFRCPGLPNDPTPTYVVDGGYVENSLFTLLQVWEGIEAHIETKGLPADVVGNLEPWILVADNHYRSSATASRPSRPRELLVPLIAKLNTTATLSQTALEQMATERLWPYHRPDKQQSCQYTGLIRIAPMKQPNLEAPLGWVLSQTSRDNLETALQDAVDRATEKPFRSGLIALSKRTDNPHKPECAAD